MALHREGLFANANLLTPAEALAYLDVLEGRKPMHDDWDYFWWSTSPQNLLNTWLSLSAKAKAMLSNSGKTTGSRSQNGLHLGGGKARAIAVLLQIISKGGKDIAGLSITNGRLMSLDHKVPICYGGKDHPSNWQLLSAQANQLKRDSNQDQFIAKLRVQASRSKSEYHEAKQKGLDKSLLKQKLIKKYSSFANRSKIDSLAIKQLDLPNAKALAIALGLTYRTDRLSGGTGVLNLPHIKMLIRDALAFELVGSKQKYLAKTVIAIDKAISDSNKISKNPVKLPKSLLVENYVRRPKTS